MTDEQYNILADKLREISEKFIEFCGLFEDARAPNNKKVEYPDDHDHKEGCRCLEDKK